MDQPEIAIRAVRAASNAMLAARDAAAAARCWAPDYVIVTSTNAYCAGRAANAERLAGELLARPDLLLMREPTDIAVFAPWGMAAERGVWRATWTGPHGPAVTEGTYFAKWQRFLDEGWLILAEVYVPTAHSGTSHGDRGLPRAAEGK